MTAPGVEARWLAAFVDVLHRCGVKPGDACAVLAESQSRPVLVQLATLALQFRQYADVEQVRFIQHLHHHSVGNHLAILPHHPGAMPGRQGVGKIAARPWKAMSAPFRRHYPIQVGVGHVLIVQHYFAPPRAIRSAVVNATLSRT